MIKIQHSVTNKKIIIKIILFDLNLFFLDITLPTVKILLGQVFPNDMCPTIDSL